MTYIVRGYTYFSMVNIWLYIGEIGNWTFNSHVYTVYMV